MTDLGPKMSNEQKAHELSARIFKAMNERMDAISAQIHELSSRILDIEAKAAGEKVEQCTLWRLKD